jgi:hypothetical protein
MAQLASFYIASTTAGMSWHVYSFKPDRGPAYIAATEGTRVPSSIGDGYSFTCDLLGSRKYKQEVLGGRATKANIIKATKLILSEMAMAGVIKKTDLIDPKNQPVTA